MTQNLRTKLSKNLHFEQETCWLQSNLESCVFPIVFFQYFMFQGTAMVFTWFQSIFFSKIIVRWLSPLKKP